MQKVVFVEEIGKPMRLRTRPIPKPSSGHVLIKVTATMCTSQRIVRLLEIWSLAFIPVLPHDTYGRDRGLFIH